MTKFFSNRDAANLLNKTLKDDEDEVRAAARKAVNRIMELAAAGNEAAFTEQERKPRFRLE